MEEFQTSNISIWGHPVGAGPFRMPQEGRTSVHLSEKVIWVFPKIGVGHQNGWFIMENLIKMDDLGGTPIFGNTHIRYTNL